MIITQENGCRRLSTGKCFPGNILISNYVWFNSRSTFLVKKSNLPLVIQLDAVYYLDSENRKGKIS